MRINNGVNRLQTCHWLGKQPTIQEAQSGFLRNFGCIFFRGRKIHTVQYLCFDYCMSGEVEEGKCEQREKKREKPSPLCYILDSDSNCSVLIKRLILVPLSLFSAWPGRRHTGNSLLLSLEG